LRSLIASVLGSNVLFPGALPVYYGEPYYPDYTSSYYSSYYTPSFAAVPYYYAYEPDIAYSYYSRYGYDPYSTNGFYDNVLMSSYPTLIGGGGFAQELFSNLLAVGYEQGYLDGLNARRHRRHAYYYDPYEYSGTNYLTSYSLGANRSCLSDGYQLGYQDALYNPRVSVFDPDANVDLVSVLASNALQVL
jgi:hypothetical protein